MNANLVTMPRPKHFHPPVLPSGISTTGEWLMELRSDFGWTQGDLESETIRLGKRVDTSYISKLENNVRGIHQLDIKMVEALRVAFRQDLDTFEQRTGVSLPKNFRLGPEHFDKNQKKSDFFKPPLFPTLLEIYQSKAWRTGDVFTATWDNSDGFFTIGSSDSALWMTPDDPYPIETLTVDPTRDHRDPQIGVYVIRGSETIILSIVNRDGRAEFTYRHTTDTKNRNLMRVPVQNLDYLGRVVSLTLNSREI